MDWKYVVWRAAPALLIILLISYYTGGGWQAFPSALVAWGTLMLAYVTFLSIKKSIEQSEQFRTENERLRQEDRKRELERHATEFIYNWARHVSEFTFITHTIDNKDQLLSLWENVLRLRMDGLEARQYAYLFDVEIQKAVDKVVDDFADFSNTLNNISQASPTLRIAESGKALISKSERAVNNSAMDLVESITNLKIKLKL